MCHRRVLDVGMGNVTYFLLSKSGSVGITVTSLQECPRLRHCLRMARDGHRITKSLIRLKWLMREKLPMVTVILPSKTYSYP